MPSLRQVLVQKRDVFTSKNIETAWLDACLLLAHVLHKSHLWILTNMDLEISTLQASEFEDVCNRRLHGECLAYILGQKEFWSFDFLVGPGVLVPRPETEILVEWILEDWPTSSGIRYRDICTGTGCIPLSILSERPHWSITASDLDTLALSWAYKNQKLYDIDKKIGFFQANLFESPSANQTYDVISANPPYVPHLETKQKLAEGWKEPKLALDGGIDGLDLIRQILTEARSLLKQQGKIYLEFGDGQVTSIKELAHTLGYSKIDIRNDLAGIPRILRASLT